jgi:hypothetical protein
MIRKLLDRCSWRVVNLVLTCVWAAMVPVTVITGWVYSLVFISLASIYANFASHLAAWRADVPISEEINGDT